MELRTVTSLMPGNTETYSVNASRKCLPVCLQLGSVTTNIVTYSLGRGPLAVTGDGVRGLGTSGVALHLYSKLSGVDHSRVSAIVVTNVNNRIVSNVVKHYSCTGSGSLACVLRPAASTRFLQGFLYRGNFGVVDRAPIYRGGGLCSMVSIGCDNILYRCSVNCCCVNRVSGRGASNLRCVGGRRGQLFGAVGTLGRGPATGPLCSNCLSTCGCVLGALSRWWGNI